MNFLLWTLVIVGAVFAMFALLVGFLLIVSPPPIRDVYIHPKHFKGDDNV